MDKGLRYTYWNKASEDLTGIPAQDAIGKFIHEIFADTPETRRAVDIYQDVIKTKQPRSFENEYNLGGKRFYFDISVYPTADGIAVISTDITRHKRMEDALLLTRYSIDSTPDTIVTVSQDGLFVDVNEGFCRSSGYSRDELLSMTVHDIDPEFTAEVWPAFWNKLKQSGSLIFETMHRSKEGKNYPVEIMATYFEYNGKEYHCGFAHDITERKLVEKRLQESEKRYRNVVQDQTEFICRFLPDGTHIFANEAYCSYFGKTCDLIINTQFKPSILQQDRQIVKEHFTSLTPQHPIATIEHRIVMPDGQIRWQQWNDRAIFDANGKLVEYQSVGRDTTDRKLMEEEILSLNQTLEQRVKERTDALMHLNEEMLSEITQRKDVERQLQLTVTEKETLLKEIHHRVKNNLQIIASLLNLQSQYINDEKTLAVMKDSQNRIKAMALIHEKIYQSKSLDRIDYGDYLEKITRSLFESYGISPKKIAMQIHAKNIVLHIDKAIPCSLIINELLTNSFKHAFPNDRTGEVRIDIKLDGDTLQLIFSDNGIGLPESITLNRTESLGMRLISGLIQQLKGTVEIKRGEGTTFVIAFKV
jgi:PAS domain S-box-containing protein